MSDRPAIWDNTDRFGGDYWRIKTHPLLKINRDGDIRWIGSNHQVKSYIDRTRKGMFRVVNLRDPDGILNIYEVKKLIEKNIPPF